MEWGDVYQNEECHRLGCVKSVIPIPIRKSVRYVGKGCVKNAIHQRDYMSNGLMNPQKSSEFIVVGFTFLLL